MGYRGKSFSEIRCGRCNHNYGHIFHVCVDAASEGFKEIHEVINKGRKKVGWAGGTRSPEHRESMSEAMKQHWVGRRAKTQARDRKIIDRYLDDDIGTRDLALELNISLSTVRTVLKEAGVMRAPGQWISRGGKKNATI